MATEEKRLGCDLLSIPPHGGDPHSVEVKGWGEPLLGASSGRFNYHQDIRASQMEAARRDPNYRVEIVANLTAYLAGTGPYERLTLIAEEICDRAIPRLWDIPLTGLEGRIRRESGDPARGDKLRHGSEFQQSVCDLIRQIYGGHVIAETPDWLRRPSRSACGRRWELVKHIYTELAGGELPNEPPPRERRAVDLILKRRSEEPRIIEVDEKQHFNEFRAITLRMYPRSAKIAYPKGDWLAACDAKTRLEGGGFAKPRPPLFPGTSGRHRQRAFRDAMADLLPPVHGRLPTLRVADFEAKAWIHAPGAKQRMSRLLEERLA